MPRICLVLADVDVYPLARDKYQGTALAVPKCVPKSCHPERSATGRTRSGQAKERAARDPGAPRFRAAKRGIKERLPIGLRGEPPLIMNP